MFEFWLSDGNTPFIVAIGVMILLAVMQIVGLSDFIDGDTDGVGDADAGLLSILGIGRLPFLAWLMLFLLAFGLIGLSGQQLLASFTGAPISAWLAAPLAGFAALPITELLARPLAAILPKDETTAVSPEHLVGRFATIQIGTATNGSPARAKVTDVHGQAHNIMVEPDNTGQSFAEGETVLLVRREFQRMIENGTSKVKVALRDFSRLFLLSIAGVLTLIAVSGCDNKQPSANGTDEVAGETYQEYDERRDALDGSRGTFADQGCTKDCSGHEAGYAWAEEKGITDPDQCGGRSWSFIEGCRAYAEQASGEGE